MMQKIERRLIWCCLCLSMLCALLLPGCSLADDATEPEEQDLSKGYILWEGDTAAPEERRTRKIVADPQKVLEVIALLGLEDQDFVSRERAEKVYNQIFQKWKYVTGQDVQASRMIEFAIMIVREDGMCAVYEYTDNFFDIDYSNVEPILLTEEQNDRFRKLLGMKS